MKSKRNKAIRELRKAIGQSATEFGAMVGASHFTVTSWELGRKRLTPRFARQIATATGAHAEQLLRGQVPLTTYALGKGQHPLTAETFEAHRKSYWGRSDEAAARKHWHYCADALRLVFVAAAGPCGDKGRHPLPAVLDSFVQWCEQAREDFQLEPRIQEQLGQRKRKFSMNKSYREWREMQKEDPDICRAMGFKDNPKKPANAYLELSMDTVPLWQPGLPMRGLVPDETETAGGATSAP